jgi:hypothetical protein
LVVGSDRLFFVDWDPEAVAMPRSVQARRFYRPAKQRFDDALLLLEMERTTADVCAGETCLVATLRETVNQLDKYIHLGIGYAVSSEHVDAALAGL